MGLVLTCELPFSLLGTPIASWIIDASNGSFVGAFLFSGLCIILSNVFLLPIMLRYVRIVYGPLSWVQTLFALAIPIDSPIYYYLAVCGCTLVDPRNKLNEVILSRIPNVGLPRKYEEED